MSTHIRRTVAVVLFVTSATACGTDRATSPATRLTMGAADAAVQDGAEWSAAVNLGPVVNSASLDIAPELSKDGLSLYFASNRPGGFGGNDLHVSRRASLDAPWEAPVNLGPAINTSGNEAGAQLSRDGHWMIFTSTRAGGSGGNDLYISYRGDVHDDFAWEAPRSLGAPINTAQAELGPSSWGPEFYFWRAPPTVLTPGDIHLSRMQGDAFGDPEPVAELNSVFSDEKPGIRFDGREIVFSSDRAGTFDIFFSTRAGPGREWEAPEALGPSINTSDAMERRPSLSSDGLTLLFDSNRLGGSGNFDLYTATRTRPY